MKDDTTLIDEVLEGIPNKYMAVIIASKRARSINDGLAPSIKTGAAKPTTMALEEIAAGEFPKDQEALETSIEEKEEEELLPSPEIDQDEDETEDEEEQE